VTLIEWPEKLDNPGTPGLWVNLKRIDEERREINFFLQGETNQELIAVLQEICHFYQRNNLSKAEGI